jgi:hypothetical protein
MIKEIYIAKGKQAWLLPIYSWLGICVDAANGNEYEFPEEDECCPQAIIPGDILALKIDKWASADFAMFLYSYECGEIGTSKETFIYANDQQFKRIIDRLLYEKKALRDLVDFQTKENERLRDRLARIASSPDGNPDHLRWLAADVLKEKEQ